MHACAVKLTLNSRCGYMMAELEKRLVVALCQGHAQNGDVSFNLDKMKRKITTAASVGAEMILFPELFLSGYRVPAEQMTKVAEEKSGPSFQELSKAAQEANIAVLYGYPEVDRSSGGEVLYDSAQLIDKDGSSLINYRKTHVWICPEPSMMKQYLHQETTSMCQLNAVVLRLEF